MGNFDEKKYQSTNYGTEIDKARADLESDYPNARVFINYADGMNTGIRCQPLSLVAPDGQPNVVSDHFELPGKVFGTEGYEYHVFSEGALQYRGTFGPGYTSQSDDAEESSGATVGMKKLSWKRKGGGTKTRNRTSIDTANWMKELDGELYLSAVTIPGTHDSHALVGTPLMPSSGSWDPTKYAADVLINMVSGAKKAAECQDWDIATQLQNGIRYLDFRYGDDLKMRHGQMELPGNLTECLKVVTDFLDAHPQETVIVMAKWDKWDFITNAGHPEPASVLADADKAFTSLARFKDVSSTPQLKDVRGKIVRKKEGSSSQGLDFDKVKRGTGYDQPAFERPPFTWLRDVDAGTNQILEQQYTIEGVWLKAKAALDWIRYVRPKARSDATTTDQAETVADKKTHVKTADSTWDNTGLNSFRMDGGTIATQTTLFPITMATPTNKSLNDWLDASCSLAQRYELGVIQMDFAGGQGSLVTKLILTNFT